MLSENLVRNIATFIGAIFFATVGLICLLRPAVVRDFAIRNTPKKIGSASNPFWDWMQTPRYMWNLRIVGTIAMCALILLLVAVIRSRN